MDQLIRFEGNHEVMILMKEDVNFEFKGDFLICAKDVSIVLEYQGEVATSHVLKFCKEEHVYTVKNSNLLNRNVRKLHNTGEKFISNLSLNRVLGQSNQPKALPFQDWLYEDVVPSVQKRGAYLTPAKVEEVLLNPDTLIILANEIKNERSKRIAAEAEVMKLAPKVAYLDKILQSKATVTTTQIAKDYGLTATELNKILSDEDVQFKQNGQWLLYKKHATHGYTQSYSFDFRHSDGRADYKMVTRWTQRGRLFIHELLTRRGIKANVDKDFTPVR